MKSSATRICLVLLACIGLLVVAGASSDAGTLRKPGAVQLTAEPKFVVTGRIKVEGAAGGLAGLKLRLIGLSMTDDLEAIARGIEGKTDDEGRFRFEGNFSGYEHPEGKWNRYEGAEFAEPRLRILEGEYTFPDGSRAWQGFSVPAGNYDGGDFLVVKGGRIHVTAVHQQTGEPISTPVVIEAKASYVDNIRFDVVDGSGYSPTLPPQNYTVTAGEGHGSGGEEVEVVAGEVAEVELRALPKYLLQVELYHASGEWENCGLYAKALSPDDEYDEAMKRTRFRLPGLPVKDWQRRASKWLNEGEWEILACNSKRRTLAKERVTLPSEEPLRMFIGKVGGVKAEFRDNDDELCDGTIVVLPRSGDGYEHLRDLHPGDRTGRFQGFSTFQKKPVLHGVPTGNYLMLAGVEESGVDGVTIYVREEIEIKEGEVKEFVIRPPESRLRVKVMRNGSPAANETLYVWQGNEVPDAEASEVTTDTQGVLDIPAAMGHWFVATPRELAWLEDASGGRRLESRIVNIAVFRVMGTSKEFTLQIGDRDRAWVAVDITGELADDYTRATIRRDSLSPEKAAFFVSDVGRYTDDGRRFELGHVDPGTYLLEIFQEPHASLHIVEVKPGDNEFKFDFSGFKLSLSAALPRGGVPGDVEFVVRPALEGYRSDERYWTITEGTDGRAEVTVPEGSYCVVARVRQDGEIRNVGSRLEVVKGDMDLAIELSEGTGSITITCGPGREKSGYPVVADFGDRVTLPDPDEAVGWSRGPWTIHGLEDGRYTFELVGYVTLPHRVRVRVKDGENVRLEERGSDAIRAIFHIEGMPLAEFRQEFESCVPIRRGREMEFEIPSASHMRGNTALRWETDTESGDAWLYVYAIPPGADAVRIKLKHYHELNVELTKENVQRVRPQQE